MHNKKKTTANYKDLLLQRIRRASNCHLQKNIKTQNGLFKMCGNDYNRSIRLSVTPRMTDTIKKKFL